MQHSWAGVVGAILGVDQNPGASWHPSDHPQRQVAYRLFWVGNPPRKGIIPLNKITNPAPCHPPGLTRCQSTQRIGRCGTCTESVPGFKIWRPNTFRQTINISHEIMFRVILRIQMPMQKMCTVSIKTSLFVLQLSILASLHCKHLQSWFQEILLTLSNKPDPRVWGVCSCRESTKHCHIPVQSMRFDLGEVAAKRHAWIQPKLRSLIIWVFKCFWCTSLQLLVNISNIKQYSNTLKEPLGAAWIKVRCRTERQFQMPILVWKTAVEFKSSLGSLWIQ